MGTYLSVLSESYPPKPQFRSQDIPDLSGKVAIVTGATAGKIEPRTAMLNKRSLGSRYWKGNSQGPDRLRWKLSIRLNRLKPCVPDASQELLNHNAKVYFGARSREKGEKAIQELKVETGKEGILLELDLSDLKSVKAAAEVFQRCVIVIFRLKRLPDSWSISVAKKRSFICCSIMRERIFYVYGRDKA